MKVLKVSKIDKPNLYVKYKKIHKEEGTMRGFQIKGMWEVLELVNDDLTTKIETKKKENV